MKTVQTIHMATQQSPPTTVPVHKPSASEKLFFLISGIIVSVPLTLFIDNFALPPLAALQIDPFVISTLVLAPLIEEFAKAYPLFYRHGETERSYITFGALTGFGFGLAEFTLYVASGAPVSDRIFGLLFHTANTSIVAYGVSQNRTLPFYVIAVFLHLLANLSAAFDLPAISGLAATGIAVLLAWTLYNKTSERTVKY